MKTGGPTSFRPLDVGLVVLTFSATLTIRVWGISSHFWLLGDQIRDWSIALRPFGELPLIGPPTHVGGYTIGPAFYWILWAIRVTIGPWFENLPHAGGIGQAILQSGVDCFLLVAVWRRTRSLWIGLTTAVLLSTAAYDLCLSAIVWNPIMGSTLAKMATALVLLDWHRESPIRTAVVAGVAWSAVHAYTGAIFVAVSVFAALLGGPLISGDRRALGYRALAILVAVVLLQVPYVAYQMIRGFGDSALGAVWESIARVLSGSDALRLDASTAGYTTAFRFIQIAPWDVPFAGWVLLVCGGIVAIRHRHDPPLLAVTLLPQAIAVAVFALFLAELDHYYYLSLMPAAVLTVVLAVAPSPAHRRGHVVGMAMFAGALALVPARLEHAATMHRMPQYGLLVDASRKIRNLDQPMRAIRTEFELPPTSNPEFLYSVLGGVIDRQSPWVGTIMPDGRIDYRYLEER